VETPEGKRKFQMSDFLEKNLIFSILISEFKTSFYSPSPEYPVACYRDDRSSPEASTRREGEVNRDEARQSVCGLGYGAIPL
jgi:hypothetical protein